nr:hypothetical protein Iba_scaffold1031415CG0010 [Ipomoea batatas]GME19622.1 hypothetical protein Iba_scaffold23357CG0030 [Ipomoea batatas]
MYTTLNTTILTSKVCKSGKQLIAYQNHMLSSDINFQVARNLRLAAGDCAGTVGLDTNNVDGDREVDFPDKIS